MTHAQYPTVVRLQVGDIIDIRMPWSEVCCHMGVADQVVAVEIVTAHGGHPVAQLWKDGRRFSFPILTSEAGIYTDELGLYSYSETVTGEPLAYEITRRAAVAS